MLTDITAYMRIEQEKEQLARFPGENPNPVMRVNGAGLIVYANKAGTYLLDGWGRKVGQVLPDDLSAMVGRLRGSGDHEYLEARCRDRVHSIVVASVKYADYVNLYARDITQAKDAENQLIKANETLREHDRLKSEFVSTVSHELRTPLCIFKNITSNAMAGVMGKISRKLYESLKMAEQSIDRLSGIISDFLDISKIEADCLELNVEIIDVQTVLADIVDSLQALARAKGIEIKVASCVEAPEVSADPARFAQILTNLIGNAIKFIPANGHITVAVKDCQDEVQFTVEDDGPGLSEQEVEKVFDRFVQLHFIAGPGEHGTGLGLAITCKLVEMHGGRIWVESALGEGCRFHFVLPKCRPSAEEDGDQPELVESRVTLVGP
jgi:signal transduction histidine kinase